jgi:transcriptional regulator with XRE-family HTH domain
MRLRQVRRELGVSLRDLELRTGVSHVTIHNIESGVTKDPRPTTLRKLAAGLGVDIREITRDPMVQVYMPNGSFAVMGVDEFMRFQLKQK